MLKWIGRLLLAGWFVGMVVVAVRGVPVQGQTGEGEKLYFPNMLRMPPSLFPYMGLVKTATEYYTIRADGSEWALLAASPGQYAYEGKWSPDGKHFVYQVGVGTQSGGTWITDLATRQPRMLIAERGYAVAWSPDSSRIAFFARTQVQGSSTPGLYLYHVITGQMEFYPLPYFGLFSASSINILWSPTSDGIAWKEHDFDEMTGEAKDMVWLWAEGAEPKKILETDTDFHHPGVMRWSPNGTQFYINLHDSLTREISLYRTDRSAAPATLWLAGYELVGWINNGTRLLLINDRHLYGAPVDGSHPALFTDKLVASAVISPDGAWVMYAEYTPYTLNDMFIQSTTSSTRSFLELCQTSDAIEWQTEGPYFDCFPSNPMIAAIGSVATEPPRVVDYRSARGNIQFLPQSPLYYSVEIYEYAYPSPNFKGTEIKIPESDYVVPVRHPYTVLEWRYMP